MVLWFVSHQPSDGAEEQVDFADSYLEELQVARRLARNTITSYSRDIRKLGQFAKAQRKNIADLTSSDLQKFVRTLNSSSLCPASVRRVVACTRGFFRFLIREGYAEKNPAEDLTAPRADSRLPKDLTWDEVEALINQPDTSKAIGIRDRALIELLYATGMRVSELLALRPENLNLNRGYLVCLGKGNKERIIPIGDQAVFWVSKYSREARSRILGKRASNALFVTSWSPRLSREKFWKKLKQYALAAGLERNVTPHMIRHSFATHLLKHGADLITIQKLLGHVDVSTTQIYTSIMNVRLQQIYKETHPRK